MQVSTRNECGTVLILDRQVTVQPPGFYIVVGVAEDENLAACLTCADITSVGGALNIAGIHPSEGIGGVEGFDQGDGVIGTAVIADDHLKRAGGGLLS